MKLNESNASRGSVLITTILTLTIIALLCATSLYVTSQNTNATMQTSSWQQSLTGSETGIDLAIRALNTNVWTGWSNVPLPSASPLPAVEPIAYANASPVPSAPPDTTHYLYLPSTSTLSNVTVSNTEGASSVSTWVTIDTAGMDPMQDTNGKQWYRVRSTGQAAVSGPARASANKLDNSLRNTIGLIFNRKGGTFKGPTRTVEVILQPLSSGGWVRGITLANKFVISGSGVIDSFNSSMSQYSTNGMYDVNHHLAHGDVGTGDSSGSSISGGAHLFGSLGYSGPAVSGANNTTVSGTISTPFTPTIPGTFDPTQVGGSSQYTWSNTLPKLSWPNPVMATTLTGGNALPKDSNNNVVTSVTATSTDPTNPTLYVINSGFTVSGGNTFTVNSTSTDPNVPGQIAIWVKGKYTTSGSGMVIQGPNTKVTWIVDSDITTSGNAYSNSSVGSRAANTLFVAVSGAQGADGTWPHTPKVTISGTADWIGQISAPASAVVVSGGGSLVGALIADNLNVSGGSGVHYDEALKIGGSSVVLGNYAFASWFEDNSAPARKIYY